MTNRTRGLYATVASLALGGALTMAAQSATRQVARPKTPKITWSANTVLPFTCAQAWVSSGRRYPELIAIVQTDARVSLANRGVTFPNTREAGLNAGRGIAADCKADPHGLLFAVVDKHVRRVAEGGRGGDQ